MRRNKSLMMFLKKNKVIVVTSLVVIGLYRKLGFERKETNCYVMKVEG